MKRSFQQPSSQPSRKRRKTMCKISKSARVVACHFGGRVPSQQVKRMAQIIGQFSGSDVDYRVGERLIQVKRGGDIYGSIYAQIVGDRASRCVHGQVYKVYRVAKTTACTVTAILIREYHTFSDPVNTRTRDLMTKLEWKGAAPMRTFRQNDMCFWGRQRDEAAFQELDTESAVPTRHILRCQEMRWSAHAMYDVDACQIVARNPF